MKHTFTVSGMHCNSCKILVTEALEEAGAKQVAVRLDEKRRTGMITLESELPTAELKAIIEEQGEYTVL
jgi:copper chaperone CopZ